MTEPTPPSDPIIDPRAFWRAIGHRATGSTVVTAVSYTHLTLPTIYSV